MATGQGSTKVQHIHSEGNASGLKAIASVAVFVTLITAAFAPYLFSRQELTAMKAEFDRKLQVQEDTQQKRVDYLQELIDRDLINLKNNIKHLEEIANHEEIRRRITTLEECRVNIKEINSRQDETDEWIIGILSIVFKETLGEEIGPCTNLIESGASIIKGTSK